MNTKSTNRTALAQNVLGHGENRVQGRCPARVTGRGDVRPTD